jgi:hypothetical protein
MALNLRFRARFVRYAVGFSAASGRKRPLFETYFAAAGTPGCTGHTIDQEGCLLALEEVAVG